MPSPRAIGRFIAGCMSDPLFRSAFVSLTDPDGWKNKFRPAFGNASEDVKHLNQRWEMDASPADVMCTDGRYSLYVVIDVYSRDMMSLVVPTPRSDASLLAFARACAAWGLPDELVTDKGSDFVSYQFKDAMRRIGVVQTAKGPYMPERKPHVERVIKTIQHGMMPLLFGYIGHNPGERSKIEKRKSFAQRQGESDHKLFDVSLTGAELQACLDAGVAKYRRRKHRTLRTTPELRAQQGEADRARRLPEDAQLGILLMPPPYDSPTRVVTKKGVSVGGLDYFNVDLLPGQVVQVRLDPADLGKVHLFTDADPWEYIGAAVNLEMAGKSRAAAASAWAAAAKALVKEQRARLRSMRRRIDLKAIAAAPALLLGQDSADFNGRVTAAAAQILKPPRPAPVALTEEEKAAHAEFVAGFKRPQERPLTDDEEREQRLQRFRTLRTAIGAGEEVDAESLSWFEVYSTTPECRGELTVEEAFAAGPVRLPAVRGLYARNAEARRHSRQPPLQED
jgi:transposase InsO family protein